MDELSLNDIRMMYDKTLVLRKGIPVFIRGVDESLMVHAWNLVSQKFLRFKFKHEDLKAPSFRLGYLNLGTSCVYISRIPARVYKAGLNTHNLRVNRGAHLLNRAEEQELNNVLTNLSSVSLYKTIKGVYPSLMEAYRQAKENTGTVAFDRQFSVDLNANIYYRGEPVGALIGEEVVFPTKWAHLAYNLKKRK